MPSGNDDPINKEEVVPAAKEPPAVDRVVVDVEPSAEDHAEFCPDVLGFAKTLFLKGIGFMASIPRRLLDNYQRRVGMIKLPSPLKLIVIGLVGFAEMKAQGSKFPFESHPESTNVAIASLGFYGLASAADHFIPPDTRLDPDSLYPTVAHFVRMSCLCIFVASFASLFYLLDFHSSYVFKGAVDF